MKTKNKTLNSIWNFIKLIFIFIGLYYLISALIIGNLKDLIVFAIIIFVLIVWEFVKHLGKKSK